MNFQVQLTGMGDCKTSRGEGCAALWAQARQSCATGNGFNNKACIFHNWNSLKTNFGSIPDFPIHTICRESQGLCLVTGTHSSLLISRFLIGLWLLKMETWAISHCPIRALGILCTAQPIEALVCTTRPLSCETAENGLFPTLDQVGLQSPAPAHSSHPEGLGVRAPQSSIHGDVGRL